MTSPTDGDAVSSESSESAAISSRTAAWMAGALVLVLIVLGLASGGRPQVSDKRVLVIGDSLTDDSEAEVKQALTATGWDAVVDGRGGLSIGLWRKPLVDIAKFVRPNVAVVSLGTNNCDTRCSQLAPVIDDIIRTLVDADVEQIFWVNVQEANDYPTHSDYVNFEIERAAVRWPQVRVIDLDAAFGPHPEWHIGDFVHFNDVGSQQFGILIANALAERP